MIDSIYHMVLTLFKKNWRENVRRHIIIMIKQMYIFSEKQILTDKYM